MPLTGSEHWRAAYAESASGATKASSKHEKPLEKNDLEHVSNKMRILMVLEAIEAQPHNNSLNS